MPFTNKNSGSVQQLPNSLFSQAQPYIITVGPIGLPLTLTEVKLYLKIDDAVTEEDNLLTRLISTASLLFERYTGRTILITEFKTFRNDFRSKRQFELLKSPFVTLVSFDYLVNDVLTAVDNTIFYTTIEEYYSRIILRSQKCWPTNIDEQLQAIEIRFTAGIATDETGVPADIKQALLITIANLYENRGDCLFTSIDVTKLPQNILDMYNNYRIISIATPGYREANEPGY